MTHSHTPSDRNLPARLTTIAALLVMLASALLMPATAMAQEPGTTVPQPVSEPPPDALPVSALPLPALPPFETEVDLVPLVGPDSFVTSEVMAAMSPVSFLPSVAKDHAPIQADRMGFGTGVALSTFPDVRSLYAGWYVNWGVSQRPERPAGIEFMQMVRVHQNLANCEFGTTPDRKLCPYAVPASYTMQPSAAVITSAAKLNPGSVWLIGNEIDRPDWNGGRQDEITPELYAVAYHEVRAIIKAADPTARIAIGGVIQFTPLRKQYLDKVWSSYQARYGSDMPVDVWNVHNFIGSEYCVKETVAKVPQRVCYGMAIPAGITVTPNSKGQEIGAYYGDDHLHVSMETFRKQIFDFRTWMKNHGQIAKPLIVSEYGVLYKTLCGQESAAAKQKCVDYYKKPPRYWVDLENASVVQDFMLSTFDFFTNAKDCSLSSSDDCRLVQRWAWYSLEEASWNFNPHTALYNAGSTQRSVTGDKYSAFSKDNVDQLQYP